MQSWLSQACNWETTRTSHLLSYGLWTSKKFSSLFLPSWRKWNKPKTHFRGIERYLRHTKRYKHNINISMTIRPSTPTNVFQKIYQEWGVYHSLLQSIFTNFFFLNEFYLMPDFGMQKQTHLSIFHILNI